MSTNLAFSLPATKPRERDHAHPRQIEIVTTRSQRRARPRLAYALVAVGGLFAIFLSQLLLSIALSNGAYQISSLLGEQRDLGRVQGALTEQLELAASTQNLAANAQNLGMVATTAPAYLRLSDGQLVGAAVAATASANDKSVITNSLLAGVALLGDQASATEEAPTTTGADGTEMSADAATAADAAAAAQSAAVGAEGAPVGSPGAGAPAATDPTSSVPSTTGALPSPVTH